MASVNPFQTADAQFSYDSIAGASPLTTSFDPSGSGATTTKADAQEMPSFMTSASPTPAATPAAQPSTPQAAAAPQTSSLYTDLLGKISSATDPQQRALLQDELGRNLYSGLKADGHDVKWQGDQLIVDGRPYVLGSGIAPGEQNPNAGPAPVLDQSMAPRKNTDPYAPIQGFDFGKLSGSTPYDSSAKYSDAARTFSQALGSGVQISRDNLGGAVSYAQQHGFQNARAVGDDKIDFGDGNGPIDVINSKGEIWFQNGDDRFGGTTGGSAAVQMSAPRSYDAITSAGASSPAPSTGGWMPGHGPTYTPGEIPMDDIPQLSYDDLMAQIGDTGAVPSLDENYSFNGFDFGQAGSDTDSLVRNILENPDAYPPQLVGMLKAQSKDDLAQMQQQDDQELVARGFLSGNQDSNWLESERRATRGRRDQALIQSDRNIDMEATKANVDSRRNAATLGMSYRGQRQSEQTASEQLRGQAFDRSNAARQQNIDNLFHSQEEKRASVQLASDQSLKAAALRGDRLALREATAQKAADLGISQDQVMSSYLLGLMEDATRRHGIDIGAAVDRAKLEEQSAEWKEELAYRLAALSQADEQFGASYGLDYTRLQHDIDQDQYGRSTDE